MYQLGKSKYSVQDFLKIVAILRFSNSMRWSKTQNHDSIKSNLIEKAYETLESINTEDSETLKENLGDILFQIIYHCDIEEENENFSFEEMVDCACRKIICKYPHIFPQRDTKLSENENCKVYDLNLSENKKIRYLEKQRNFKKDTYQDIKNMSNTLPALMRTSKIQERAARLGYGLFSVEDAVNEAFEKLHYLETLIINSRRENYEKVIGDLLFSIAEISRLVDIDSENALYNSCERFKKEFQITRRL